MILVQQSKQNADDYKIEFIIRIIFDLRFSIPQKLQQQQKMSDQQYGYDDWMQAADEIEKKQQQTACKQDQSQTAVDQGCQILKSDKKINTKQQLKQKIAQYKKMEREDIERMYQDQISNQNIALIKQASQLVLKSQKDFKAFGKMVAQRLSMQVKGKKKEIDEQNIVEFMNQLILLMYRGLEYKNIHDIQEKMKAVRTQRKNIQKKLKKSEKQEVIKQKNQEDDEVSKVIIKDKIGEDAFDGAGMDLKQEDEERKNKKVQKKQVQQVEQIKKPVQNDDDDDFM